MKVRHKQALSLLDAFKWTGGADQEEEPAWAVRDKRITFENSGTPWTKLLIQTEVGENLRADRGDWIMRDAERHLFFCKPEEFHKNYEPIVGTEGHNGDEYEESTIQQYKPAA